MSGYKPQNPYMPYGGMRSSKTGSRAIAGMQEPSYAPFQGIGSLPNAPVSKPAPLQGGLGKVRAGGRDLGDLWVNQTGRDGAHGRIDMPQVVTQPAVNEYVSGGGRLNRAISKSLANPVPAFEGGQMLDIDPRSGYDPMAIMQASRATSQGLDPQSEEYAQMLLGHPVQPQVMPQQMQPLPEEMTAQALPMDRMQGQAPFQPDASGFQMRDPQMDEVPAQLPADLDNPFQDVANTQAQPRSLTREDDLNNGFDPNDPYQQYAMPRYNGGEDPFYKGVNNVAMAGLDNKQRMDKMRWDDWNRAKTEQGWNDFAGSVLTPLAGVFAKDPGTRQRIQQSAQGQLGAYDRERQLRNSERAQQFGEDKYYTDIRQANDPNSYPNWLAGQNANTNRLNAATGVTNARSNQQYRQDMINSRQDETERKAAWDQWKMQHGDNQDSWNAFNSLVRQNQGQQRIDNQQNQFTAKQAQQDAQFQRAQALREQQAQQQIAESRSRIQRAAQSGDYKSVELELKRQQMIMEANKRDKDGNFIYPDETAAAIGADRAEAPVAEKKPSLLESMFGGKPKAEAPAPAPKKNIAAGLSSKEPKQFDRNNDKHKALVQEARAKFGDNVDQAKAWLRAKGLKV